MGENFIILEGSSLQDLIKQGAKELNKSEEQVDIEILEKSTTLFGIKSNYKVKIYVRGYDKNTEENVESINYINNKNGYFELTYKDDGVYLTVYEGVEPPQVSVEEVFNKLERKKVKGFDIDTVKKVVKERKGMPIKIAGFQQEELIDAQLFIEISQDKMIAYATLLPPDGGIDISLNQALKMVNDEIKYGLDVQEIKKLLNNKLYNKKIIVAKGKEPLNGTDAKLNYLFNIERKITPEILENGSVDFRNLHLIENVKEGDILAEIIPATDGEPGITVTGEMIPQKRGKDVKLKYGKNVGITDDGLKIYSLIDGQVCLEGEKVVVYEVYKVDGDVDNSTGNLEFNGNILIKGNVRTGFEIRALGNVEIEGVVEGAIVECQGNIFLKSGVQGYHKGFLSAKGNIVAKYLENCSLYSEGDINAEAIMHSNVISKNSIIVKDKKGLIVGGTCRAGSLIHAKTFGSPMETVTVIEVGVDPDLKKRYESLTEELNELNNNIEKLDKSITLLNRLAKTNSLTEEKKELLIKFLKARKILGEKQEQIKKNVLDLETQIEVLSNGKIIAENVIYPGVKIIIGNSYMFVKKELKNCIVYREQGEIKVISYR